MADMRIGAKRWCWWMSRWLIYCGRENGWFVFEDFGDRVIRLTAMQVAELRKEAE